MNGSYTVPMGISRSPNSECDRPAAPSSRKQVHLRNAELDMLAFR